MTCGTSQSKPKTTKILVGIISIILLAILVSVIIIMTNSRKERRKIFATYPTVQEILDKKDEIVEIRMSQDGTTYSISTADKIDEVLSILEDTKYTPIIPKAKQDAMPTGFLPNSASISIFCSDKEVYYLELDNEYYPSDFFIERSGTSNARGYYKKDKEIYKEIRFILFSGDKQQK